MHLLIIKGTLVQARASAEKNNIPLDKSKSKNSNEVYAITNADLEKIIEWYCKPKTMIPGFGYEAGSLVYYSEISNRISLEKIK